jgi:hypothetical protein
MTSSSPSAIITAQGDGFDVQERRSGFIIGGVIKFDKNVYLLNKTEEISGGTINLLVVAIVTCWVHWWDNKITEHRVPCSGQLHPQRDDLPDNDKTLWQPGLNGDPADPWVDRRYVHLIDLKTGQDFTFITDTFGGRMAVGELKSSIRNVRMAHPNAMPIIKFGYGSTFPTKKWGPVAKPAFIVAGWHHGIKDVPAQSDQQLLPPAKSDDKSSEPIVSELPKVPLAQEMDDAIPTFKTPCTILDGYASKPTSECRRRNASKRSARSRPWSTKTAKNIHSMPYARGAAFPARMTPG